MVWSLLLLIAAIAAMVWIFRARRAAAPAARQPPPMANDWGRQPPQAQQSGMSGQVMGGLATGLALGAGAVIAQEIGRNMAGDHAQAQGSGSTGGLHDVGGSAADSPLARDAGLGSVGLQDNTSWDGGGWSEAGSFDGGFDGGDGGDGGGE